MPSLRILMDENVPFARELFSQFGTVVTAPGAAITREKLQNIDALIVRSVTRVDTTLLKGTPVRFVGSATIGTDHIETEFLHHGGTAFAHAPGSNADSVVEYVIAALLLLSCRLNYNLTGKKVGVIGCGNVGGRLSERLPHMGLTVLKNDPPLAEREERAGRTHDFHPLEEVLAQADILSLHVPLVGGGEYPTAHLLDDRRLRSMRQGSWMLNTSRGAVVDNRALLDVLRSTGDGPDVAVLDVWEDEPAPLPSLIERAELATPHIAGYSYDGKIAGAIMVAEALARYLGFSFDGSRVPEPPPPALVSPPDPGLPQNEWLNALVKQMYDIAADDDRMRALVMHDESERSRRFAALRRDYPMRRTFGVHAIARSLVPPAYLGALRNGLGVDEGGLV